MRIFSYIIFLLFFNPSSAFALQESVYSTETFNQTFIYSNTQKFAPTPEGGVGWDVFATTIEIPHYDSKKLLDHVTLQFTYALKAYDKKNITMRGYMFPLDDTEAQSKFLFGPFPMTCPYHYHNPPTIVLEAHAKTPIKFGYESMVLQGTLELVANATDSPYYRLLDATEISDDGNTTKSWHPLYHGLPPSLKKDTP